MTFMEAGESLIMIVIAIIIVLILGLIFYAIFLGIRDAYLEINHKSIKKKKWRNLYEEGAKILEKLKLEKVDNKSITQAKKWVKKLINDNDFMDYDANIIAESYDCTEEFIISLGAMLHDINIELIKFHDKN